MDGQIDLEEWTETFTEEEGTVKILDNVMKQRGLNVNGLLNTMGISRTQSFVNQDILIEGVLKLDPSLTQDQAKEIFTNMFDGKEQIEIEELVQMVESYQCNKKSNSVWLATIQAKLKLKFKRIFGDETYLQELQVIFTRRIFRLLVE